MVNEYCFVVIDSNSESYNAPSVGRYLCTPQAIGFQIGIDMNAGNFYARGHNWGGFSDWRSFSFSWFYSSNIQSPHEEPLSNQRIYTLCVPYVVYRWNTMLGSLSPDVKHSKYPFRPFGLFGVFDAVYPHICVLILFRSVVMTVLRLEFTEHIFWNHL